MSKLSIYYQMSHTVRGMSKILILFPVGIYKIIEVYDKVTYKNANKNIHIFLYPRIIYTVITDKYNILYSLY